MGLAPEAARQALDAQRIEDWHRRRRDALKALSGDLGQLGTAILASHWYQPAGDDDTASAAARFEALSAADRTRLLESLHPSLGGHLERMWQLGKALPYQSGWYRRGFRSSNPQHTLWTRWTRLVTVSDALRGFDGDATWVAQWAGHLVQAGFGDMFGVFLAAVLDGGGRDAQSVDAILRGSASGEEGVGVFGRHVTKAYLAASDPAGWVFVEQLLLSAQRQEGLRQAILEAVDEAHPDAFRRMIRAILDQDLLRFSATVRALVVWLGVAWDVPDDGRTPAELKDVARDALRMLDDRDARTSAIATGSGGQAYLALWASATADAPATIPVAARLLGDADPERRYAAAHLLGMLGLEETLDPLARALDDADLRVAACALDQFAQYTPGYGMPQPGKAVKRLDPPGPDVFDAVERLLMRMPSATVTLPPIIWRTNARQLPQGEVARVLVSQRRDRPIRVLLRHLPAMEPFGRSEVATALIHEPTLGPDERKVLVSLAGDPSQQVRGAVLGQLGKIQVQPDEIEVLEGLLDRKAEDLRRALLELLVGRSDEQALASADRLLAAKSEMGRLGGLEILRRLHETGRSVDAAAVRARAYRDARAATAKGLGERELVQLTAILGRDAGEGATGAADVAVAPASAAGAAPGAAPAGPATLDDGLGLLVGVPRSRPVRPRLLEVRVATPAAVALITSLDAQIDAHGDEPLEFDQTSYMGYAGKVPLAEADWQFPKVAAYQSGGMVLDLSRLPFRELWETWWRDRPPETRDPDGNELIRARTMPWTEFAYPFGRDRGPKRVQGETKPNPRHPHLVATLLDWMLALVPAEAASPDAILDLLEVAAAALEPGAAGATDDASWRALVGMPAKEMPSADRYVSLATLHRFAHPEAWTPERERRLWGLLRFVDEPYLAADDPAVAAALDGTAPIEPGTVTIDESNPNELYEAADRVVPPGAEETLAEVFGSVDPDEAASFIAEAAQAAGLGSSLGGRMRAFVEALANGGLPSFGMDPPDPDAPPEPDPDPDAMPTLPGSVMLDPSTGRFVPFDMDEHLSITSPYAQTGKPRKRRRRRPSLDHLLHAFRAGAAIEGDVIDSLIGPRSAKWSDSFENLAMLTRRTQPATLGAPEPVLAIAARVRERVVEVELGRGEAPTAASIPALALSYVGGSAIAVRLLRALGNEPFVRGWMYSGESRSVVFSRLLRGTFPSRDDDPAAFRRASDAAGIKEKRLIELAMFAPQWAGIIEGALGWPGFAEGVWWMHAHTKDEQWSVDLEVREAWIAEVAERTPLPSEDLVAGAVDRDWFARAYARLGEEHWRALDAAAKYGSTSGGHKRAQLFADAIRGTVSEQDLRGRIAEKRQQDPVRALGLVPLPDGATRDDAILGRYERLQEFIRTSRQFGQARQASEKRAAEIGLENLARTAGYADPIRLGWAMEARGIADLADGPLVVEAAGVTVSLEVTEAGEAEVTFARGGVALKSLPPAVRKVPEVAALRARATDLRKRGSRVRASLEASMVRGDRFTGAELRELAKHPLVWPVLGRLVLVAAADEAGGVVPDPGAGAAPVGWPIAGGLALREPSGREHALGPSDLLRIAHPLDLVGRDWPAWQTEVFRRELVQPFRQVFREVYLPVPGENEGEGSRRYAGHQLQPRQALAILGGRGWVNHPEEGVRRTFHDARLTAWLQFEETFLTPAEVEYATVATVHFTPSASWESVPLTEVPARIFSEVMRDLDLVVSVAHAGGVDPEASASTVEMRAAIVEETAKLLAIDNVRLDLPRAVIRGSLAEYSVHLGSAVTHLRPGGSLFIVPVHGQHRGRLFLPFADDDPKTAEVVSKVLLLARDREIRDPSILEQIRLSAR